MEGLDRLERILDVPASARRAILAEVRLHLEETRDDLIRDGTSPEKAARLANERLGPTDEVAGDFMAVYGPGRRTFLLLLAPFLMCLLGRFHHHLTWGAFAVAVDAVLFLTCLLFVAGTVWAIARSSRPAWLSTWLGGSIPAFMWLKERLNIMAGGTLWGPVVTGWLSQTVLLTLLPATLCLWLYRRRRPHIWYVIALWASLLLSEGLLAHPRLWLYPPAGPVQSITSGIVAAISVMGALRGILSIAAWILLAAAVAPPGRGNWAIYSSLAALVHLLLPLDWSWWNLSGTTRFWVAVTIGPMAMWLLLYSRKRWTKIAALASAVIVSGLAMLFVDFARIHRAWPVGALLPSVLWAVLAALVVVAPLLIWYRRNGTAGQTQISAT